MKTQYAKVQTLVTALNSLSSKSLHSAVEEIVPQLTQEVNTLGTVIDESVKALVVAETAIKKLTSQLLNAEEAIKSADEKLRIANEKAKEKANLVAKDCCKGEPMKVDKKSNPIGEPQEGVTAEAGTSEPEVK